MLTIKNKYQFQKLYLKFFIDKKINTNLVFVAFNANIYFVLNFVYKSNFIKNIIIIRVSYLTRA